MFTAKNICFLSPSVCSRCWLPSTASNLVALLKEGKKVHCLLGFNSKKMNVFQIKVLWKEQTSSPAHNDNLNWIEKFQYATAATAAATSSSIYSISIQARCCFALFHPQHNYGYMCSFTWAQIFVFGSIGFISLAYPLNEILDYVLIWMCAALNERSQVFFLIRESPSLVRETDVPLLC